jgi:Lipocalin-like domain
MTKFASLAFACLLTTPSFAADGLTGTWKLVSNNYEVQASGQTGPSMGENPAGYINFTTEGRVFVVFSASDRKPAKSDQEKAALLSSLTAYTGMYKVDGDTFTTDVDVAWTPEWVGTKQKREFKLDGDKLQIVTVWRINPNMADRGMTRGVLTFARVK